MRAFVCGLVATSCAAIAALVAVDLPTTRNLPVALVLGAVLVLQPLTMQRFRRGGGETETITGEEAAFAALLVVVDPSVAVLTVVLAALASELAARRQPLKAAFNVGSYGLAAALPALLLVAVGPDSVLALAAGAILAAAFYAAGAQVLLAVVLALVGVGGLRANLADDVGFRAGLVALNATLGGLGGVAVAGQLAALPLAVAAMLAGHVAVVAYARARAGRDRLRDLVSASSDAIVTVDADFRVKGWNPAAETFFGFGAEGASGRPLAEVLRPVGVEEWAPLRDVAAQAIVVEVDRVRRSLTVSASTLPDGGQVLVARDVTSAAAAHAEARQTQRRLRRALHFSHSAAWEFDLDAGTYVWSENLDAVSGSRDGHVPGSGLATEDGMRLAQLTRDAARTGEEVLAEVELMWPDGSRHWVEIEADVGTSDAGTTVLRGLTRLVDRRKQVEAEREAANEAARRSLALLDQVADGYVSLDRDGRFTYLNRAAERHFGRSRDELVGRSAATVCPDLLRGPVEDAARAALDGAEPVPFAIEYEPFGIDAVGAAYPAPDGVALVYRDVRLERTLEAQLRQSQKMEALGQLAGGVAHDFNNLLTAINGNADLALLDPELPDEARALVGEIVTAGARAGELTQRLLAFSRRRKPQRELLSPGELVRETEPLVRRLLGSSIQVDVEVEETVARVRADGGQLAQVLLNLIVNGRDAMPEGGRLAIVCGVVETHGEDVPPDGSWVRLTVADQGVGIPEKIRDQIFEPFFTTKAEGRGTGLGLSTVIGIVEQHGGHIAVESEPGAGTTFHVYLPAAADAARDGSTVQRGGAHSRVGRVK